MKLQVQPSTKLKDGAHEGVIIGIEYREQPHKYTEIIIECESTRTKYGLPTIVSPDSRLGKLLLAFGFHLDIGSEIEPEVLIGKKCKFLSNTNDKGYPVVVKDTLKPLN